MRLRHASLVATDPLPLIDDLATVFDLEVSLDENDMIRMWGPDMVDEFGLSTVVLPVGDTFLEVISPTRPDTPAGRYLARHDRPAAGYMAIVQCDDIEAARSRAAQLRVREVWEGPLDSIRSVHFDPRDLGGCLLSLEEPDDPADWPWAGPSWRDHVRTNLVTELTGAEITDAAPADVAARWAALLDRDCQRDGAAWRVPLDGGGTLRFLPLPADEPAGLRRLHLRCGAPEAVRSLARSRGLSVDGSGHVHLGGVEFELMQSSS